MLRLAGCTYFLTTLPPPPYRQPDPTNTVLSSQISIRYKIEYKCITTCNADNYATPNFKPVSFEDEQPFAKKSLKNGKAV